MLTILGQNGVPFSYVIRESAAPDYAIELQPNYDSKQLFINCVAFNGLTYETDAIKVHQLIHAFVPLKPQRRGSIPKKRSKTPDWNK